LRDDFFLEWRPLRRLPHPSLLDNENNEELLSLSVGEDELVLPSESLLSEELLGSDGKLSEDSSEELTLLILWKAHPNALSCVT
ncbi:hypothetical protein DXG01_007347, partial [Tephrocybe rancida]